MWVSRPRTHINAARARTHALTHQHCTHTLTHQHYTHTLTHTHKHAHTHTSTLYAHTHTSTGSRAAQSHSESTQSPPDCRQVSNCWRSDRIETTKRRIKSSLLTIEMKNARETKEKHGWPPFRGAEVMGSNTHTLQTH